jgi:hypothetical protein
VGCGATVELVDVASVFLCDPSIAGSEPNHSEPSGPVQHIPS